ncbi:unnamed protein product [Heterotrigona itama]|uniref:Uncharacterized protein n=1 Tax=Heterotrigona itama TaxID=395501 RepID=A0A6V7HLX3_9HYME|nr:unnamed protein product [Heterotrigona itama]
MEEQMPNIENLKLMNFKTAIIILLQYYQLQQQTPELH